TPLPGAQGHASERVGGKTLRNLKTIEQISRSMTLWISRYGRDVLSRNFQWVPGFRVTNKEVAPLRL
ncbi:MAG: hypothetical protein KAT58_08545, partial [candidate division Zixibacteria bacterium]|nr:hypothetical protein [candidate division Zixibacteria bacterium]